MDDVHRPYNLAVFEELAARFPPDGRFFHRYGNNILALGAGEWRGLVRSCFEFLEMPFAAALSEGDVKEDGEDD